MHIQMVVRHRHPILGKGPADLLQGLEMGVPVVLRLGPEPHMVLDGALAVGGKMP